MIITLSIFAVIAAAATFGGGVFALRYKDQSHFILGFSAGAVLGVAFFDLLPEALELGASDPLMKTTSIVALGFVLYMIIDRLFHTKHDIHEHEHEHDHNQDHHHDAEVVINASVVNRGSVRASSLSLHSLLDGVGIGLAFQVSTAVGVVVAVAVLAHDFSDGINTVTAIMKDGGTRAQAMRWLMVDAIAPAVGLAATLFFTVPAATLGIILALFCGFFLYIGASDLIPESYHSHPTKWTTIATILGAVVIYVVIGLAG